LKRELFWILPIFILIIISLFGVHYLYLLRNGFDEKNYITAFLILLPASLVIGYILFEVAFQKFKSHEENLEHIVREVLHEINLPISTIKANIAMLKRSLEDNKSLRRMQKIEASSKRLQRLYQELAYEIKREISPVIKKEFDLKDLIIDEVGHFKSLGFDRFDIKLESTKVYLDRVGLERVVDNIIENSLKYSDDLIEIRLKNRLLSIKDYGLGINENKILNIYQRYYQGDNSKRGQGIGLAIVKRYCDENHLRLKISSLEGRWTLVEIEFG